MAAPSQASVRSVSLNATAGAPSRARSWRMARWAACSVRPSRRSAAAEVAVCNVRKVARSASVPR